MSCGNLYIHKFNDFEASSYLKKNTKPQPTKIIPIALFL